MKVGSAFTCHLKWHRQQPYSGIRLVLMIDHCRFNVAHPEGIAQGCWVGHAFPSEVLGGERDAALSPGPQELPPPLMSGRSIHLQLLECFSVCRMLFYMLYFVDLLPTLQPWEVRRTRIIINYTTYIYLLFLIIIIMNETSPLQRNRLIKLGK